MTRRTRKALQDSARPPLEASPAPARGEILPISVAQTGRGGGPAQPGAGSGIVTRADSALVYLETKVSRYVVAFIVAEVLMRAAFFYVTPAQTAMNHGVDFARLATEPFNFALRNELQNRILTPLLAHVLGFTGDRFIDFVRLVGVVFLATIYVAARREGLRPATAALGSAVMAFSTPILFFVHFAGYTDITSYLFVFLAMVSVRIVWVWPVMLALAFLNHESNFFVVPWFFAYHFMSNGRRLLPSLAALACLALSAAPWYMYTQYVAGHGLPRLSAQSYLQSDFFENLGSVAAHFYTGFFASFKLLWLLPLVAAYQHLRDRDFLHVLLYLMIVGCSIAQLLLASDTSRLIGLSFPAIWLGFLAVARGLEHGHGVRYMLALVGANLLVPQYYVGQHLEMRFYSVPSSWLLERLWGITTWVN